MVCISSTTTSAPRRSRSATLPCSRITASTRLSRDAPTRAATSLPTVPWEVETSRTPPFEDGLAHVDGGAALAQDGPRPLGGCVVGQPGLDGGEGLGLVLAVPAAEVPGPPFEEVGVGDLRQHGVAVRVVGQQAQPVQDGVLLVLVRLGVLVGLVEGLDGLFEDGLHPRPPLLPQALCHADHRVGGAVAVCEDAGVEEVDAGGAGGVRQVYDAHPVREGVGDVFEDAVNEVGVGVYDDDGVRGPCPRPSPASCGLLCGA